ncbi:MAG TPA: BrxA/BrxB family bacilliredoxin [Candidatus Krumholzibacteria bacterium]|nr:BrxA/BrxB family bacilliredoxin [Candidatus Krumholzibacteria bacterium]HRX51387.1 BrxA/BrxB family bacilliredoxin [Candidatus Krumholzibacteria bacterium]
MPYPEEMVAPMRAELVEMGVRELRTAADVDAFFADKSGTSLILVNSVCGCAAGSARPGLGRALRTDKHPDRVATVFAGQDLEPTAKAREHFGDIPPSSPSMALFKDGELVHFVPRHMIEGRDALGVAAGLIEAFEEYC